MKHVFKYWIIEAQDFEGNWNNIGTREGYMILEDATRILRRFMMTESTIAHRKYSKFRINEMEQEYEMVYKENQNESQRA